MAKTQDEVVLEKDSVELALEKAVFGDFAGFDKGLRDLDFNAEASSDEGDDEDENEGLADGAGDLAEMEDGDVFFVDEGDVASGSESDSESDNDDDSDDTDSDDQDEDAWKDSDDERLQVSLVSSDKLKKLRKTLADDYIDGKDYTKRLRNRFERIYPVPKWAADDRKRAAGQPVSDDEENEDEMDLDSDDEPLPTASNPLAKILSTSISYVSRAPPKLLPPGELDIGRLKDATMAHTSKSAIQALDFHPTHPLVLSGGYDRTLRIYHIDGKTNSVATSLHIRRSPFQTAVFHPDGRRVFAAGRRRYLWVWDIETGETTKISRMFGHEHTQKSMERFKLSPCGRFIGLIGSGGWLNVLSATSGQWIAGAKIEGVIADFAWHSDGNKAKIVNTSGEVWEWDSNTKAFTGRWRDESGVGITTIALGAKDRWCALGTKSGVVSIYDTSKFDITDEVAIRQPKAVLGQLVTSISTLQFSNNGQMLVVASRAKKDALRIVHVPSFTVFSNWPTAGTPLGRVTSVALTPGSEMLCTGNEGGKARLWKLNHFSAN